MLDSSRGATVIRLLLLSGVCELSTAAYGGYEVEQKLLLSGAAKDQLTLSWKIDGSAFRLDVLSKGADPRTFVFNGRVFYVCGKPDANALKVIGAKGVLTEKASKKLQQGACQEASIDFAIRFALSPYEAVSAARSTIGYGLSTTLSNYELKGGEKTEQLALKNTKSECSPQKRKYLIADKSGESRIQESLCINTEVDWRQKVGRELAMSLMRRQDKAKARETLKIDTDKLKGLILKSKGVTAHQGDKGEAQVEFALSTDKLTAKTISKADLGMPKGYHTLDLATLAGLKDIKVEAQLKGSNGQMTDLFEQILLGVNPSSILFTVVGQNIDAGNAKDSAKENKGSKASAVSNAEEDD